MHQGDARQLLTAIMFYYGGCCVFNISELGGRMNLGI